MSQSYVSCWTIEALLRVLIQTVRPSRLLLCLKRCGRFLLRLVEALVRSQVLTTVVTVSVGGSKLPVPNKSSAFLSAAAKSDVTCWLCHFNPFGCFSSEIDSEHETTTAVSLLHRKQKENLFFLVVNRKNQCGFLAIWCSAKTQHTQFLLKVLVSDFYLVCSFKRHRSWFE